MVLSSWPSWAAWLRTLWRSFWRELNSICVRHRRSFGQLNGPSSPSFVKGKVTTGLVVEPLLLSSWELLGGVLRLYQGVSSG